MLTLKELRCKVHNNNINLHQDLFGFATSKTDLELSHKSSQIKTERRSHTMPQSRHTSQYLIAGLAGPSSAGHNYQLFDRQPQRRFLLIL